MAAAWWKKGAAAGDSDAMYGLGYLYDTGEGVQRSRRLAFIWWHKAAAKGNADAKTALADRYEATHGFWFSLWRLLP